MNWPSVRFLSLSLWLCAALCAAAAALYLAFPPAQGRAGAVEEVVVAALGDWDEAYQTAWQGLELAAKEINQTGGINGKPVKLWRQDVMNNAHRGVKLAKHIADNPQTVLTVLFSNQLVSMPAATVLSYYHVLTMLTRNSAPLYRVNLPLLYRMCPTDSEELDYLTSFCISVGLKRAAMFVFNAESSRLYANTFEAEANSKGMKISARINCDKLTNEGEFLRELNDLRTNHRFDAIFYSGPPDIAVKLLNAAALLNISQPFLGGSRWDTQELASVASPQSNSVYIVTPFTPDHPNAQTQRFIQDYLQTYGKYPDHQAAINYNSLRIYAEAASRAGSTEPEKVELALTKQSFGNGLYGEVRFNSERELMTSKLYIKHFAKGKFTTLDYASERKSH